MVSELIIAVTVTKMLKVGNSLFDILEYILEKIPLL